jgi:CRISPR-associated protein Csm5
MNYRLTVLTPTLVGDGNYLSPIDYMVWKDQVNVLDQRRIFKLLAKGPRLEGYLQQLSKAQKLDFASWGGFAQNYAGRRIPFESFSLTNVWNRTQADQCFIPTFCSGPSGAYLPASALKGALRTGLLYSLWREKDNINDRAAQQIKEDRIPRRLAPSLEETSLGSSGSDRMRAATLSDSSPVARNNFKVYLLRTATVVPRGNEQYDLGWKGMGRGASRADDALPTFAEMAIPGAVFSGHYGSNAFFAQDEIRKALHWRHPLAASALAEANNLWAAQALTLHQQYAERLKLTALYAELDRLQKAVAEARARPASCLVCLGWGAGLIGKSATLDTQSDSALKLMRQLPYYQRAIQTGLPFPKTRRIVFHDGQPATLPGWAVLDIDAGN